MSAFVAAGGTAGLYVSPRVPFAYDYADEDTDVSTTSDHGTHVAALALGWAQDENGALRFQGRCSGSPVAGYEGLSRSL